MSLSFFIATFGCKVNQYDSQVMREKLLGAGWDEKPRDDRPDVVIVNTCTVTHAADAKARRLIRRIARELPDSRIVVTGCMVNRDRSLFDDAPCILKVVDNEHKVDIPHIITSADDDQGVRLCAQANTCSWPVGISGFAGHTRAFVKVQDGCDAWCAYCIVPAVRGKPRSRPMNQVLDEVGRLSARFKEIVLTGIHLGLYRDASGADLAALVRTVLETSSVERVRVSSIEVNEITPELVEIAARSRRFCPHFHVPLQSGSDRVLARMNRRYTAQGFLRNIDRVRAQLDRPAFTTDVMVGFPGETDHDFAETVAVCRTAGFSRMHIFPYSGRPGTAAATMSGKCPASVIHTRKKALEELACELALAYKKPFVGETVGVLVETSRDRFGRLCGFTGRYLRVVFDGPDELRGRILPVRIARAEPGALFGRPGPEDPVPENPARGNRGPEKP